MKLSKLRLCKEASSRVRFLAGKTGLTPNLLCRIGFCISLEEPNSPDPRAYPEDDREFNRYTLLGEYDTFFIALLKERATMEPGDWSLEERFRAHMNRGVLLLQKRLKHLDQLADIVPSSR